MIFSLVALLEYEVMLNETKNFGNSSLSVGYYQAFYNTWNNTSNPYYNGSDYSRLNFSIQQAYTVLNNSLNQTESEIWVPLELVL